MTSRGNEKKPVFKTDTDRQNFLNTLQHVNKRYNWLCHAYCLMTNHYHLLIETPDGNLALGMRQMNGVYTQLFNKQHGPYGVRLKTGDIDFPPQFCYLESMPRKPRIEYEGAFQIDFEYLEQYKKTRITTRIKDSSGNLLNTQVRTTEYDSLGQPSKATDTFGNVTTYSRDGSGNILQEGLTDIATGVTTTAAYSYDSKGNMLTKTEALGTANEKNRAYSYDPLYNLVTTETASSVVNPSLYSVVTNSYDSANSNLLTRTESGYLGDGVPHGVRLKT